MHIPRAIVDRSNSVFFHVVDDNCAENTKKHHIRCAPGRCAPELSLHNIEAISHDILSSESNSLAEALSRNLFVRLTGDGNHHLLNVLRLGIGASVEILYRPNSSVFRGAVSCVSENEIIIRLYEQIEAETIPKIHLLVGLIKPQKADVIVEQCAELGVSSLVFFAAERSQNRGEFSAIEKRLERWTRIAKAATLQSGFVGGEMLLGCQQSLVAGMEYACDAIDRSDPSDSHSAKNVFNRFVFTGQFNGVAAPRLLKTPQIMSVLRSHLCPHSCPEVCPNSFQIEQSPFSTSRITSAVALIGPEGGLTDNEIAIAVRSGFVAVSLGGKTLRTEVAALLISGMLIELLSR